MQKRLLAIIYGLLFFVIGSNGLSQNLSYAGSKYNLTSEPGVMVTPQLEITNTGTASVSVFVKRFYMNLPANWTCCFCYIQCNPPTQDTLAFTLMPAEKAYIGIGFSTDMIPGIGTVKLTVEEVGNPASIDTLVFTGETMVNGIRENNLSVKPVLYPNPTEGKIFITAESQNLSFILYNQKGQLIKQSQSPEFDLASLPKGIYYIRTVSKNGSDTQKIIKD